MINLKSEFVLDGEGAFLTLQVFGLSRSTPRHLRRPAFRQMRAMCVSPHHLTITKLSNSRYHPSGPSQTSGAKWALDEGHASISSRIPPTSSSERPPPTKFS